AVYVYEQDAADASAWNMIKKLTASDSDGVDSFGYSVALNGGELLVGAPNQAGHGAAYLYGKNQGGNNNWGEVGSWAASDADNGDRFGADVDLHGNRAIIGAPGDDAKGTNAGAAYRYNRGSNGWAFGAKLTMGQGAAGDAAGTSVAVHGANLLVGAPYSNLKANNGGAVFAFTYDNANNVPVLDNNGSANDHFGTDVAVDSNYLAISAPNDDPTGANSGKVFVFIRDQSGWNRLASVNDIYAIDNDHFGNALALSGQTLIVGEYTDGVGTIPEQGSILVFDGVCPTGDRPDQAFVDRNEIENTNDLAFEVTCSPVPFSDMLSIQVGQETPETVHVSILNALGQTIVELNKQHFVGNGRFVWQANTNQQGVFFVRVQSGNSVQTKPVMRVTEK
ncbi:MAG: T9SS type A sorting domain-containing protein, partial [Saprospiraceae bacterium]|nr:T9SS type A sorting domain-containing protein [Saprospiraceae bacterium]